MIQQRLRNFHGETGGQITFLMVFGAVLLVGLMGNIIETTHLSVEKVQLQNITDAATLSGGVWIARGLNLTSAFNVMETQLVGAALLINALHGTCEIVEPIVQVMQEVYCGCAATVLGCIPCCLPCAITTVQMIALKGICPAVEGMHSTLAKCPKGLFWVLADVLSYVNEGIRWTFYGIAATEAVMVARQQGADGAAFLSGRLFHVTGLGIDDLMLPTKKGTVDDLCEAMVFGTPPGSPIVRGGYHDLLGYPLECGWQSKVPGWLRKFLRLPKYQGGCGPWRSGKSYMDLLVLATSGFPPIGNPIFEAYAANEKAKACGGPGGASSVTISRPMSIKECYDKKKKATWTYTEITSRWFTSKQNGDAFFDSKLPPSPPIDDNLDPDAGDRMRDAIRRLGNDPDISNVKERTYTESCRFEPPPGVPPYKKLSIGNFRWVDEDDRPGDPTADPPEPPRYRYVLRLWMISETPTEDEEKEIKDTESKDCKPPEPHMLVDEEDALRYLTVVWTQRKPSTVFLSKKFIGGLDARQVAYAQSEVYNVISQDTFTQDWRVRLQYATLLEIPFRGAVDAQVVQQALKILNQYLSFLNLGQITDDDILAYILQALNH